MLATLLLGAVAIVSPRSTPPSVIVADPDPVALTMATMRVVGTLVTDARREHGALPLADGRVHVVRELLSAMTTQDSKITVDGWGRPLRYRALSAGAGIYEVLSYGEDGTPDVDYAVSNLYPGRFQPVVNASNPRSDLVLVDGRFTRRPFGDRIAEFETINAINAIFMASASFAVDNNVFPGNSWILRPVSDILPALIPIYTTSLPSVDGWGHPILYASDGSTFVLVSGGEDGVVDFMPYSGPCGLTTADPITVSQGGDVVQACGSFTVWPRGTEP